MTNSVQMACSQASSERSRQAGRTQGTGEDDKRVTADKGFSWVAIGFIWQGESGSTAIPSTPACRLLSSFQTGKHIGDNIGHTTGMSDVQIKLSNEGKLPLFVGGPRRRDKKRRQRPKACSWPTARGQMLNIAAELGSTSERKRKLASTVRPEAAAELPPHPFQKHPQPQTGPPLAMDGPTEYTECWPCPLFDILLNKYFPAA